MRVRANLINCSRPEGINYLLRRFLANPRELFSCQKFYQSRPAGRLVDMVGTCLKLLTVARVFHQLALKAVRLVVAKVTKAARYRNFAL